jgi:signal transduction histidine kinase
MVVADQNSVMTQAHLTDLPDAISAANAITRRLGTLLDLEQLTQELTAAVCEYAAAERAVLLVHDEPNGVLRDRNQLSIHVNERDPIVRGWLSGVGKTVDPAALGAESPFTQAAVSLDAPFYTLPLVAGDLLQGVVLVANPTTKQPITPDAARLLDALAPTAAIALKNARLHSETVAELAAKMHELRILRRIDRELMDTIELEPVFTLTLDWALRFTNAHAATLALYDQDGDELYGFVDYGYEQTTDQINLLRASSNGGIARRVALSGRAEIVPDVSLDNDYLLISNRVKSHLSLPVMREDRVVAVISVESRRLNAFTDDHVEFVEKLASRAGVAIDNARLYTETDRERAKLSRILSSIADPVIVIGADDRIALLNQSAIVALALPAERYEGKTFSGVFADSDLARMFHKAKVGGGGIVELKLADARTFSVNTALQEGIGWIIVMHDITPMKLTDQLKTELVQTVSHDLKQPLSIMGGYVELLMMQNKLDAVGENYGRMILRSVAHMRQLIEDLLDLAKIESGVALELSPLPLKGVIDESIEAIALNAQNKETEIANEIADDLPLVAGDHARLTQIFTNLVGNAVKYSPAKSTVRVWAESGDEVIRVGVRDNGIGISPEDQARIFDRFYRVRRPETKDIEGTGLGLAIVKRLVEAHGGQIGIESRLGEGTTFYVSLPVVN